MESKLDGLKDLNKAIELAYSVTKELIDADKLMAENYLFGCSSVGKEAFERVRILRDMLAKLGAMDSVAGGLLDAEVYDSEQP